MVHSVRKPPGPHDLADLAGRIEALREDLALAAARSRARLGGLSLERRRSAENLLQYLALRRHDLRPLQEEFARLGLNTLDSVESHVLASVDAIVANLRLLAGYTPSAPPGQAGAFLAGTARLERNTERLLGPPPPGRDARIMVTLPDQVLDEPALLTDLLSAGMDCLRINCAYGDQAGWLQVIERFRESQRESGRAGRLFMDLRGPKLRTGPVQPREGLLKIRPLRSEDGRVLKPACIRLIGSVENEPKSDPGETVLTVDPGWLQELRPGDSIRLRDARGARRRWRITECAKEECLAESRKTTYLRNGVSLRRKCNGGGASPTMELKTLPPRKGFVAVRAGDLLVLSCQEEPGQASVHATDGRQLSPGVLALPIPEIFSAARPGEPVRFDDGHIAGVIERVKGSRMEVRVQHTRKPVERLSADKGVNFPDTHFELPALSPDDQCDLPFIARHADIIGLSFTNRPEDVSDLRERLRALGRTDAAVILKIETRQGRANLPGILLEAMKFPACGVMIARGDLAAELGFEALAALQEDILRICEAAHVPVIWATGVLDGLAKRGHPTRAEITDAAQAQRAECVMLGKGAFATDAVSMLHDILSDVRQRQHKQTAGLPPLQPGH